MSEWHVSKALALAIGYTPDRIRVIPISCGDDPKKMMMVLVRPHEHGGWREFSYLDHRVIYPIAEHYNCFPRRVLAGLWASTVKTREGYMTLDIDATGETPPQAIATLVITMSARSYGPWRI